MEQTAAGTATQCMVNKGKFAALPARAVLTDLSTRRTIFISETTQSFLHNMVGTVEHVLQDLLVDRDILRRVEQEGVVNRIRVAQQNVMNSLISPQRLNRLVDYQALARPGEDLYSLTEMLRDTRNGVWTELTSGGAVSIHRRSLQRSYLESVDRVLNPPPVSAAQAAQMAAFGQTPPHPNSDVRPALRGELMEIDRLAAAALNRTSDAMTRLHLRDVRLDVALPPVTS